MTCRKAKDLSAGISDRTLRGKINAYKLEVWDLGQL